MNSAYREILEREGKRLGVRGGLGVVDGIVGRRRTGRGWPHGMSPGKIREWRFDLWIGGNSSVI